MTIKLDVIQIPLWLLFYNIHTHVYCHSQPRLFSHNKPNTYREIIKQFIRSHLGLLFIIPFCQVRTDFNNINVLVISLGIEGTLTFASTHSMTKKSCNIYSTFPFELGSRVCFLSEVNFYFSMIHSCACTVLHNI